MRWEQLKEGNTNKQTIVIQEVDAFGKSTGNDCVVAEIHSTLDWRTTQKLVNSEMKLNTMLFQPAWWVKAIKYIVPESFFWRVFNVGKHATVTATGISSTC